MNRKRLLLLWSGGSYGVDAAGGYGRRYLQRVIVGNMVESVIEPTGGFKVTESSD